MSWDIYGNRLRPGYCEVHPDVPQEYPCVFCDQQYESDKRRKQEWDAAEREYHLWEARKNEQFRAIEYLESIIAPACKWMMGIISNWKERKLKHLQSCKEK